jgi:sugar phosphate permease
MKKIFYGWYIVAAALVLTTFSSMMFVYGFTAFMDPIATTFAWSIAQVSLASSIRGLEGGTLDPIIGAIADRWPAKRLMIVGSIIVSFGIFFLSRTTSLWMFYGGFLIVGLGSSIGIHIVPATVVARWFRRNIGKANGVLAMGFALGWLFVPMLTRLIDTYGWQNTLMYMSVAILLLGIPLSFVFRDRPEDYGMLPDGAPLDADKAVAVETHEDDPDIGIRDALKMRIFWFMGIAAMFQIIAMQAVNIHIMTYMGSLGMDRNMPRWRWWHCRSVLWWHACLSAGWQTFFPRNSSWRCR